MFFDINEVDIEVLHSAVTSGELLVETDSDRLGDALEELSSALVATKHLRQEAKRLRKEILEEAGGDRYTQ